MADPLTSLAHHQRSSDCKFFALSVPAKQKSGRPKKGRASKASRTSSQSISTAVSEGGSITETEINEASLLAMPLVECEQSTEITRGKKSGKSRRPPTKAKAKALNTTLTEPAKSTSYNEPEDEDFEVKIEKAPARKENTYKRKSDEMEDGGIYGPNQMISDPDMNPPPPKRRTTRASNSILTAEKTSNKPMTNGHGHEMDIDDVQETASAPVSTLKKGFQKGAKKGRNEMSSAVRKASAISTAAGVSSGDIIPSDDALDAALEADLDRPLTDEEVEAGQPDIVYPRMRRLTRTRPGSRDGPPSLALERRTTRLSSQPFQASGFGQQDLLHQVASRVVEEAARSASRLTTENVLPNDLPDDTSAADANDAFVQPKTKQTKSKKSTKSRPASHQLSKKHAQPLIPSPAAGPPSSSENLVTLNHGSQVVEDESGNETDVSVVTKSLVKKGGPKGKQGKNAPLLSPMQKKVTRRELKEGSSCLESVFVATAVNPPKDALTIISSHDIQMASPNKEKYPELLEATTSRSGTFLDPLGSIKSVEGGERQTPVRSSIAVQPVDQATNIPHLSESERESTPLQALPVAENSARDSSVQTTPRPAPSPQSSDVENQPPSSRPSMVRPPLLVSSPPKSQIIRIPLVATPTASPSKRNNSRLKSTMPWSAIDYDKIFLGSPAEKENDPFNLKLATTGEIVSLTSPEKKLSLEEWVQLNARRGEEHLRSECERVIGKFEGEGVRALKTLEGITCVD